MNRILFIIFFFSSLFILLFFSCKKYHAPPADNPYGLPNATQTGQGTFGCRINGLNYICTPANAGTLTRANLINDTIYIEISPKTITYFEIFILAIPKLKIQQTYLVGTQLPMIGYETDSTCHGIRTRAPTQSFAIGGSLTLSRYDTLSAPKIVSGTFTFDIPIPDCDTLHVTDGRFDYEFQ